MDAAELFRQAQSSVNRAREAKTLRREDSHESEEQSPRIAHTLTACCRCRQRKTRCDAALPRCLPCERAGAICEYYDTAKGKKIPRTYVIRLQDKVRALEAELNQYIEEESGPQDTEDIVRPGGLVRLGEDDETPRFLGPSSGIAMTRLVMEEAKKYTDSRSIRELIPGIRQRRTPVTSPPEVATARKKSYPIISAVPADKIPNHIVTEKLVDVFNHQAQVLFPTLHMPTFAKDLQAVYDGSTDPYKNFIVRMVIAVSMQKMDIQYAGLADSYYLAAMEYMEAVIRPKDLKTLQCLVLIAQYSLLTPTRTAIYYVVGLATRLCQQLGLTEEKTIQGDGTLNPLQLDMKRRLFWIVLGLELGLAHSMGRPNAFATGEDHLDVKFFEEADDEFITEEGVMPGSTSGKKSVAIHFVKMRLLQAEIRRVLYQNKKTEPKNEEHPWYVRMEQKMKDWRDNSPQVGPSWDKWFIGRYNTMIVFLYRPCPQVPSPSFRSAINCYVASSQNIKLQAEQMARQDTDISWVFLLSIYMAINTVLWAISYPEVRVSYNRNELEDHITIALDVIIKCSERWPGAAAAHQLYSKLSTACLRSYDINEDSHPTSSLAATSPSSLTDANSPSASEHSSATTNSLAHAQNAFHSPPPQFGYVFDQMPEQIPVFDFDPLKPHQPAFRSNSIFAHPSSMQSDRRFSYFPPDFAQPQAFPNAWNAPTSSQPHYPSSDQDSEFHPTPTIADTSYFMQPTPYSWPNLFANDSLDTEMRHGSLSKEQQIELMESFETDGIAEIDNFISLSSQQYNGHIKYDAPNFGNPFKPDNPLKYELKP